jgi:hypothetical protein
MIMAGCPKSMARQIRNATFALVDRGELAMIMGALPVGDGVLNPKTPTPPTRPPA